MKIFLWICVLIYVICLGYKVVLMVQDIKNDEATGFRYCTYAAISLPLNIIVFIGLILAAIKIA